MPTSIHLLTLLFCFCVSISFAQETSEVDLKEIDQTVWKPFIESYNQLDAAAFNALHTDDVLRAGSGSIRQGEAYKASNRKNFARNQKEKRQRTIELRFDFRKAQDNIAYDTGFYKVTTKRPGQEAKIYYGYFHVVLKKIDGHWKIAQDWDDEKFNGQPIGEAHFQNAQPLQLSN